MQKRTAILLSTISVVGIMASIGGLCNVDREDNDVPIIQLVPSVQMLPQRPVDTSFATWVETEMGRGSYLPAPESPRQATVKERSVDAINILFGAYAPRFIHIIDRCENIPWDPHDVSATGDFGIAQINAYTWVDWLNARGFNFWEEWFIPEQNIIMAWFIFTEYGYTFEAWSCNSRV